MRLPTFLVIGIGRAGTTSLYAALREHPQVFVSPVKEPRFFVFDGEPAPPEKTYERQVYDISTTDLERYTELFEGVGEEQQWGEASTTYLHSEAAPANIHARIPEAKLIAVLRHPVDRAYSHFSLRVREGKEDPESFSRSIQRGEHREEASTFWKRYLKPGFYARHLDRYLQYFDAGQMKVFTFDAFVEDSSAVFSETYRFLDVDATFDPSPPTSRNKSGVAKFGLVNKFLSTENPLVRWVRPYMPAFVRDLGYRIKNLNLRPMPDLEAEVRRELLHVYEEDIRQLDRLLENDVSAWISENRQQSR